MYIYIYTLDNLLLFRSWILLYPRLRRCTPGIESLHLGWLGSSADTPGLCRYSSTPWNPCTKMVNYIELLESSMAKILKKKAWVIVLKCFEHNFPSLTQKKNMVQLWKQVSSPQTATGTDARLKRSQSVQNDLKVKNDLVKPPVKE